MRKRTIGTLVLAAVVAVFVVLRAGAQQPTPFDKTIEVQVVDNVIRVPESVAGVPAGRPGVVKWEFASGTTGFVFPGKSASAPGIVFKDSTGPAPPGCTNTPPAASAPYHNCDAKQQGQRFQCEAKPGIAGDCYSYTVTVVPTDASASAPQPLDPTIRNE